MVSWCMVDQQNRVWRERVGYNHKSSAMRSQTDLSLRVRTQVSEQFSLCSSETGRYEHSIQSLSFIDQGMQLHMQKLREMAAEGGETRRFNSSRSHSYIHIEQDEATHKKKTQTMMNRTKRQLSAEVLRPGQLTQLMGFNRCPNFVKSDVSNRIYGAIFGFLIGDSLGSTLINLNFSPEATRNAVLMKGGGPLKLKAGEGTDEWEIMVSLCEGLTICKGVYDSNIVAEKYLEWIDSNPFDLPVLMGIAFSDIKKQRREGRLDTSRLGELLAESSKRNSKQQSNLGLIRIIPLAVWGLWLEEYEFNRILKQQLQLITPNALVLQTGIVFANMLRRILRGDEPTLAFHQASQYVYNFGSEEMLELWAFLENNEEPVMTNYTANNLKFPFLYALNELLWLQPHKDTKKQFVDAAVRLLSKGFNTDTNCSIGLGLIGAVVGYNGIPSYYRSKVLKAEYSGGNRVRSRTYHPNCIVSMIESLLRTAPTMEQQLF